MPPWTWKRGNIWGWRWPCSLHLATDLDGLMEGNVDGLGANHMAVHGSDGTSCLLRLGEAHEAESLGNVGALLVLHDLGGGDGSEGLEGLAELVIIDRVVEVLDVQVDKLVVLEALHADLLVLLLQLVLPLALLLSPAAVDLFIAAKALGLVGSLDSSLGLVSLLEVHKAEAL